MAREYLCSNPEMPFADAVLVDGKTLYLSGRIGMIEGRRDRCRPMRRKRPGWCWKMCGGCLV